ncbi:hypothetical protein V8C34DRAFT_270334 [Trichoderma compactum]
MCATRETKDRVARWKPAPHYSSAQFVCAVQHGMGWPLQPEQQPFPPCLEKRRLVAARPMLNNQIRAHV